MLTDFQNSFNVRLNSEPAMKQSSKIPPHLKQRVASLLEQYTHPNGGAQFGCVC